MGSTPVHILVVGGGSIGERHVRCFLRTGRAVVSLCEIDFEVRSRLARDYPLECVFDTFEASLGAEFDAAVICTPAHLHIEMARALISRGCPLLIEKPLSTSLAGVPELAQFAAQRNVTVGVAYVLRHHPALAKMKQAITDGRFGCPVQVVVTSGQHFPLYRPAYREIYYRAHETGGGAIQDALTHTLNAAEWIAGPITQLAADAKRCVLKGVDVEDTAHVLTRQGDVLGAFSLNQHQFPNETTLTVVCDSGAARWEAHRNRWLSCLGPGAEWTVEQTFPLERDDLFVSQALAFLEQLAGQSRPICALHDGIQTLKVNLAALQSARERRWIEIDVDPLRTNAAKPEAT